MKEKKIYSIEKGYGEESTYFTIRKNAGLQIRVDEIKQEEKYTGKGYHNDLSLIVYCGYLNGEKTFEIESNNSLTITYSDK